MKKIWKNDPLAFEKLLHWLDEDRETAGEKYETIRLRLIKILEYRGCYNADEITDKIFDIVVRKIDNVIETCKTEPARYFLGVMNKVYGEYSKRTPHFEELPEILAYQESEIDEESFRLQHECLKKCLGKLPAKQREFILEYYKEEKSAKISARKQLAQITGAEKTTVRVRAFRLRIVLQKCVLECVNEDER